MNHNRIARYTHRFASWSPAPAVTATATAFGQSQQAGMVLVPVMIQAPWQAELYRRAYQQALADLAPPRHMQRYFSVWN